MRTLQVRPAPEQLSLLGAATDEVSHLHPQANRQILFKDVMVAYRLVVVKRKSIGFVIGSEGLEVRCPRWVSSGDVDTALRSKSAWILRKLQEQRDRKLLTKPGLQGHDGERLFYRGQALELRLSTGLRLSCALLEPVPAAPRILSVSLPDVADARRVVDAVNAWLMQEALALFMQRVEHFAPSCRCSPAACSSRMHKRAGAPRTAMAASVSIGA